MTKKIVLNGEKGYFIPENEKMELDELLQHLSKFLLKQGVDT